MSVLKAYGGWIAAVREKLDDVSSASSLPFLRRRAKPVKAHIFIYDPVHRERVRPGSEMKLEFLSPIPRRAKAVLKVQLDGESGRPKRFPVPIGDVVRLPEGLKEGPVDLRVRISGRGKVMVSQRLRLTIDARADPNAHETGQRIYCPAAWVQMNVGKANASPCCNFVRRFRIPYRDDHEGHDPWNSKSMQAVRAALVRGNTKYCFHACERLKNLDPDAGLRSIESMARGSHGRESNISAAAESFLRGDTVVDHHPLRIKLTVNHFCNHACIFCSRDIRSSWRANEAIFDILRRHLGGTTRVAMTGGEPLVFLDEVKGRLEDLEDALRGVTFEISTNASLVEKSIDFLSSIENLRLNVSLNAGTRATYQQVHRKDHLERVLRGIRIVKERRAEKPLYIRLKMVMTRHNRHDVRPYVEIAKELGVDEVRFRAALLYERADMTAEDQVLPGSPEWREALSALEAASEQLSAVGIRCSYRGPGWKRDDTPTATDPLSLHDEFD